MFEQVREELLERTRQQLRTAVTKDVLIMQASAVLTELEQASQALATRFREWYEYYNPDFSKKEHDQEAFIAQAFKHKPEKHTSGGKLAQEDVAALQRFAKQVQDLSAAQKDIEQYMAACMQESCPNLHELAGVRIGAQLLVAAHGLRNLAQMSSSKLQLLGAQKALFRHLLGLGKSPKHGFIMNHPFVRTAPRDKRGKAARLLADKLSIAAKLDYFKGDFLAPKLKKDIEGKL